MNGDDEEYVNSPEEDNGDGLYGGDPADDYREDGEDESEEFDQEENVDVEKRGEEKMNTQPQPVMTPPKKDRPKKKRETYPKAYVDKEPKEAERWKRRYDEYTCFNETAVREIFDMISKWHKMHPQDDVKDEKKGLFDFLSEKYGKSKETKEKEEQERFNVMLNRALDEREKGKE